VDPADAARLGKPWTRRWVQGLARVVRCTSGVCCACVDL